MGDMIFDKCGGMAVLGLMYAAAKLKLPVHVVGILTSAENMPAAARIARATSSMYNGVTVEVTNTDAEGPARARRRAGVGHRDLQARGRRRSGDADRRCVVALGITMAGVMTTAIS
jgi:leucyl aminopeptidase